MRSLLLTVTTMIACSRETAQMPPSAGPSNVAAETSKVLEVAPTASSSPAAIMADSVIEPLPGDTSGALRGLSPRDSLCGDVVENGVKLPHTERKAVASQFGRPDSAQSQPSPSRYNAGETDSTVTLFYPGLRLHYIVLGKKEGNTEILYRADVSDNRYLKYPSLGIGAGRDAIVKALGEPEEIRDGAYRYSCALHIMAGVSLFVHFEGDRVTFAEYWWDFD